MLVKIKDRLILVPSFGEVFERGRRVVRRALRPKIFRAIESGSDEEVLSLATRRTLERAKGEWRESPLEACISARRSDLACRLVESGVRFRGAVALAAMYGDAAVVRKLLAAGADPDEPLSDDEFNRGFTPLMWATNRHHFDVMQSLLAAGASVNATSEDGTTAVMCTKKGTAEDLCALELLCAYRPKLTMRDWRGRTILDEARDRERFSGKSEMRHLLLRHFPELSGELDAGQ